MDIKIFTKNNRFLMLALDHRGSLKRLINPSSPESVTKLELIDFKARVIKALSPQFSGLLIDPEFGLPAYKKEGSSKPFLLCLERTGFQEQEGERISQTQYKVSKLKKLGASGIKLLLYFNPQADTGELQLKLGKKLLDEAHKHNLPFFLEIVTYQSPHKTIEQPELVVSSLEMFLENQIIADVFKLEYPGNQESCREITQLLSGAPWILLTRGANFDKFKEDLGVAVEAGASGFLAGRALWQEGVNLKGEKQENFMKNILPQRFQEISEIVLGIS